MPRPPSSGQPGEGRPDGSATRGGGGHAVIGFEDKTSSPVLTVISFLVLAHDPEGVEDVLSLDSSEVVDMEHCSIKFGLQKRASTGVPSKRRTIVAHLSGVRPKPPRGIRQFQYVGDEPFCESVTSLPARRLSERMRTRARYLLNH